MTFKPSQNYKYPPRKVSPRKVSGAVLDCVQGAPQGAGRFHKAIGPEIKYTERTGPWSGWRALFSERQKGKKRNVFIKGTTLHHKYSKYTGEG